MTISYLSMITNYKNPNNNYNIIANPTIKKIKYSYFQNNLFSKMYVYHIISSYFLKSKYFDFRTNHYKLTHYTIIGFDQYIYKL